MTVTKLRRWLRAYRRDGQPALVPKPRSDKGSCKAIDELMCRRIISIKEAMPTLSIPELIRSLEDEAEVEPEKLKHSTVHRLLQRHGLSGRPGLDLGQKPQRLPYRYELPFELWLADVMHGRVLVQEQKVYLIAFMDSATRAIMHAAFRYDEPTLSVLEVFRQALLTRGICRRLYVDHGSAFIDGHLSRTCAELGIHHMLAPVRDGAAKGSIERWFLNIRRQFECHLQPADLTDLETLNSLLWRWIHSTYHRREHSGLESETPWQRFMRLLPETAHQRVEPGFDFEAVWRSREQRTVRRDGTVSLEGHILEVPPTVSRQRVELRYLEELLPEGVEVWVAGDKVGLCQPVDLAKNAKRRRWRPKPPEKSSPSQPVDPLNRARKTFDRSQPQQREV